MVTEKTLLDVYPSLPDIQWEKWKKIHVTETSKVFIDWFDECETKVIDGWNLKIYSIKNGLLIMRHKGKEKLPFAVVEKSTGNILCPALITGAPFEYPRGNIADVNTRMIDITPYGVKAHYKWLPTHPEYQVSNQIDFSSMNVHNADSKKKELIDDETDE